MKNPTKEDFKYITFVEIEFFKNHIIPPTWDIEASPFKRYYALVTNASDYTISVVFKDDSNKLIETLIPFSAFDKTLHVNEIQTLKQKSLPIRDNISNAVEALQSCKPEYTMAWFIKMVERGGVDITKPEIESCIDDWYNNGYLIKVIDHAVIKAMFGMHGIMLDDHELKITQIPSQPHTYRIDTCINDYGPVGIYLTIGGKFDKDRYKKYIAATRGE